MLETFVAYSEGNNPYPDTDAFVPEALVNVRAVIVEVPRVRTPEVEL